METIDIILISFGGLAILVVALGLLWIAAWSKMKREDRPVLYDDGPGNYEDVEYAERPFIEYFN